MDKTTYFSIPKDVTHGRGYVYSLRYHIVWVTKYRKPLFIGNTARWLFLAHPEIKKKLWGGHLWNPSYFVATVSDRTLEQVKCYIDNQKTE